MLLSGNGKVWKAKNVVWPFLKEEMRKFRCPPFKMESVPFYDHDIIILIFYGIIYCFNAPFFLHGHKRLLNFMWLIIKNDCKAVLKCKKLCDIFK